MERARTPTRGRPVGGGTLTSDAILAAALGLIDREGMPALSMRRLAAELAVDPMAVYYHLPNKQALLAALVARVAGELKLPRLKSGDWRANVRGYVGAYLKVARAHPSLVLHLVSEPAAAAALAAPVNEGLFATLLEAGFAPPHVATSVDVLIDFLHGYLLGAATGLLGAAAPAVDAANFPATATVRRAVSRRSPTASFEAALGVVLDGIGRSA